MCTVCTVCFVCTVCTVCFVCTVCPYFAGYYVRLQNLEILLREYGFDHSALYVIENHMGLLLLLLLLLL